MSPVFGQMGAKVYFVVHHHMHLTCSECIILTCSLGVMNYPCKVKRKPLPSEHVCMSSCNQNRVFTLCLYLEQFAVAVIENRDKEQLLLRQRPPKGQSSCIHAHSRCYYGNIAIGLLANLWEFPSVGVQPDVSRKQMWHQLSSNVLAEELDGDKVQYRELATVSKVTMIH